VSTSVTPEYPENIILEPGADVEGGFLRLESGPTKHGERPIAILDVNGVERSLWLLDYAMRNQFREKQPKPGELIRIVKGTAKKRSDNGFDYWPCRVHTPERDTSIGWDSPLLNDGSDGDTPEPPASDVPNDFPSYGQPPKAKNEDGDDADPIPF